MTTYFVTKFALSNKGKIIVEDFNEAPSELGYIIPPSSWQALKVGKDVHTTMEAAIQAADSARLKKIASLRRQITVLENLTFTTESDVAG